MTKTILILVIAAAFVAATITTTGLVYAHGGDVTLIHACVGKTLGIPRIVSPTTTCTKYENPLDWSIQGVPGLKGDKGNKGDKGDQGLPGDDADTTALQNQIDSFFDIFVDKQCPSGQVATGTNLDGSLQCTDIAQNQDCDDGFYMSGIDDNGQIKCKPLPSGLNPICGDNIVTTPETCDDGNTINGDGCSSICTIETTQICGDGVITGGEQCDDGNTNNGDGCSVICTIETSQICGDGVRTGGEECDSADFGGQSCSSQGFLGGTLSCSSSCTIDASACVASICGDNIVTAPETCDDGNTNNGDGCSQSCQSETPQCTSNFDCLDDLICNTDLCTNNICIHPHTPSCIEP